MCVKTTLRGYYTGRKLVFPELPHRKVLRLLLLQFVKEKVHRILECFVILPDLHRVKHFQKGCEVLFFHRRLVVNVADQCGVEELFRLLPERIPAVSLTLGIGHQRGHQLQDILLIVDVGERIIVHRLVKIDRIENPDFIPVHHEGVGGFIDDTAFRIRYYE